MRVITNNAFKNAFTLAEVLITLAIIGVVAAMTMPTLINNTNGAQFKTAYKKGLSVLSQAVVMNIAIDDYDLAGTSVNTTADGVTPTDKSLASLYKLFSDRTNGELLSSAEKDKYLFSIATDGSTSYSAATKVPVGNYTFSFQDGIVFSFDGSKANCTEAVPCFGWIDANGSKGPNKTVACTVSGGECTDNVIINDIYPIKMYDQTIAPASAPARAVLYGSENNPVAKSE